MYRYTAGQNWSFCGLDKHELESFSVASIGFFPPCDSLPPMIDGAYKYLSLLVQSTTWSPELLLGFPAKCIVTACLSEAVGALAAKDMWRQQGRRSRGTNQDRPLENVWRNQWFWKFVTRSSRLFTHSAVSQSSPACPVT